MSHGEHEKAAKTVHTPEPVFLLDGARFKLSFNEVCCEECGTENDRVTVEPLGMYANDLQGRWVALVPAEDDKHLDLLHIKKQRDELLAALQSISKITGEAGFNIGGPLEHCQGELEHDEAKRLLSLACEYLKDTSKAAYRAIASVKEKS